MTAHTGGCSTRGSQSGDNRRQFLKHAAAAMGSVALPGFLHRPAMAATQRLLNPAAKSLLKLAPGVKAVVYVVLPGGPSQLDMYDMKPNAPAEIRGEFRPIGTNVPGLRVCEHLSLHAKIADKFAIVNGVETTDNHDATLADAAERGVGARVEVLSLPASPGESGRLEYKDLKQVALPHGDWDTHGRVLGRQQSIFVELRISCRRTIGCCTD